MKIPYYIENRIKESLLWTSVVIVVDLIALIPLFQAILAYLLLLVMMCLGFVLWFIICIPLLLFAQDIPSLTDFLMDFPEPFTAWIVFVVLSSIILLCILFSIWNKTGPTVFEKKAYEDKMNIERFRRKHEPVHTIPDQVKSRKELHEERVKADKLKKAELKRKVQERKRQSFDSLTPHEKKALIAYYTNTKPDLKPGDLVRHKSKNLVLIVKKVDEHYITCRFFDSNEDAGRFPIYMYDFPVYKYIND